VPLVSVVLAVALLVSEAVGVDEAAAGVVAGSTEGCVVAVDGEGVVEFVVELDVELDVEPVGAPVVISVVLVVAGEAEIVPVLTSDFALVAVVDGSPQPVTAANAKIPTASAALRAWLYGEQDR
jgi:hypothetical protein